MAIIYCGKNHIEVLVDDDIFEELNKFKWSILYFKDFARTNFPKENYNV